MSRKMRLASMAFTGWLMVIIAILLLMQTLNFETFFVLVLISLFVVVALISPATVRPRYLRRIKYMVVIAFLIFAYIVANRIVEVLA